jgi:hypothetical protein
MATEAVDYIEIAHRIPGRVRVRMPFLRKRRDDAERVARRAAELPGVLEVEGHPFTGSLVVRFDAERVDEDRVLAALRDATGVTLMVRRGERRPAPRVVPGAPASAVGRATMEAFRGLDEELLRITEGGMDLGVLVTLGFVVAGAFEVMVTQKIPAPPWFNLAWWGFRTFMTVEAPAIRENGAGAASDSPAGSGAPV